MQQGRASFWTRTTDLEKLFKASHLCYLVGATDEAESYARAIRVAGDFGYRDLSTRPTLLVPVISWPGLEGERQRDGSRDAAGERCCCVCYRLPANPGGEVDAARHGDLAELAGPPPGYSQLLVLREALSDERSVALSIDLIEALESWLRPASEAADPPLQLAVLDAAVAVHHQSGLASSRLRRLLDRATVVDVRDLIPGAPLIEGATRSVFAEKSSSSDAPPAAEHRSTSMLVSEWLTSGYIANLERRHEKIMHQLIEALQQLSDVQFEYERHINLNEKLKRLEARKEELKQVWDEVEQMKATRVWQLAERYWRTRDRVRRMLLRRRSAR